VIRQHNSDTPRARREVKALVDAGHAVDFVVTRRRGEPFRERIGRLTIWRLPVRKMPSRGPLRYLVAYPAFFAMAFVWVSLLHLRRRFDVVQVNTLPDFLVFAAAVPRARGVRVLLDLQECMPEFFATKFGGGPRHPVVRLLGRIEQAAIRFAHHVITPTAQMREVFVRRGADPAKIRVVADGADESVFVPRPRPATADSQDHFTLVSHGTIEAHYGLDTTIEAVALLHERIPGLRLQIFGSGSYKPDLQELAARLGVSDQVWFSDGFVPVDQLVDALAAADVGVVAMKRDAFRDLTLAGKMFDFVVMRVPMVMSRTRSVEQVFGPDDVEWFESDDPADLARAIGVLHDEPERRRALVGRAARAAEPFRWEHQRAVYLDAVATLTGRASASPDSTAPVGNGARTTMYGHTSVIGAGPYGLAAAAFLRDAGEDVHVIGRPMSFWDEQMPAGMLLRSPYVASSIGSPGNRLSLDAFGAETGRPVGSPVPLDRFVEYGRWFQERVEPEGVDQRTVADIARDGRRFRVGFADGSELRTDRVVLAAGIHRFAHVPDEVRELSPELVSHTSDHRDLAAFAGQQVIVVDGGQSALESAALLHEAGADVAVVARAEEIRWLGQRPWLRSLGPLSTVMYAPAEVGPPILCRLVEAPGLVRRLPAGVRVRLHDRSIRPAGARWLQDRVAGAIPIHIGRRLVQVQDKGDQAVVMLDDGAELRADHILLGTGYRVDMARYGFVDPRLLAEVRQVRGYPALRRGHETSVERFHVLGAPAAWTYGPIMRFVAGSQAAGEDLVRGMEARR
jgi:glycosyltransferase involved in cell wall biosynthesis